MLACGIDPGRSGAIAIYDGSALSWIPLDADPKELYRFVKLHNPDVCWLEKVSSRTGQGVRSTFTFGTSFGQCLQLAAVFDCKTILVTPQRWQKELGLVFPKTMFRGMTASEAKTYKKNLHKEKVKALTGITTTHQTSDALLIAYTAMKLSL